MRMGTLDTGMSARPRAVSLHVASTLALIAATVGVLPLVPHVTTIALSLVFVVTVVVVGAARLRAGSLDYLEIFFPLSAVFLLQFGVGTLYLITFPDELHSIALIPYLEPALALCVAGYLALTIGYLVSFRRSQPSPTGSLRLKNAVPIYLAAGFGVAGAAGSVLQEHLVASRGGVSGLFALLQQMLPLFQFAWSLAWLEYWQGRGFLKRTMVPVIVLIPATIGLMFFTVGTKFLTIMLVGAPALTYWYARRKFPLKTIVVVLLISVFAIFPVYNAYRDTSRQAGTIERLDKTLEGAQRWNSTIYAQNSMWAFARRVGMVQSVAAVLRYTGRWVDFCYGDTIILAPIGLFIPRILWPNKPSISIGRMFGEVFDLVNPTDRWTQIGVTVVGELYWNFNMPGVILGMFLFGVGYRWFYRRYGEIVGNQPIRTAIYVTLLWNVVGIEGNVAMLLSGAIRALLLITGLLWLLRRAGLVVVAAPDDVAGATIA